jgi:acetoacetyl-CoA synthetase
MRPQWEPTPDDVESARITDFARVAAARTGRDLPDYPSLWRWSVTEPDEFWRILWDYFDVVEHSGAGARRALASTEMPGAQWFPGVRINYVDQVFRHADIGRPAILAVHEDEPDVEIGWDELRAQVAALAATLTRLGVRPGDRVVGYLPNVPEAVIAFLATASIGAVWSACGQDYTAKAALSRLGQLDPVVLVAADGYRFGGKEHDRRAELAELRAGLPTVTATVLVPRLGSGPVDDALDWRAAVAEPAELSTVAVEFDHPLWIVFSSGTTGLPKGIVHGHGGVLLEHLKAVALHADLGERDTFFWFTSPSWMMWNFQVGGLLVGATIVCYDGSPSYPTTDALWALAARLGVTLLGTSPGYILACVKASAEPGREHDLSALRAVGVTGSTLPPSSSLWLRDHVGARVQVSSISGGTDVVSAFIGGTRTVPVWPGELSVPYLGVALDAYDERGEPVRGEVGELVITAPMPSMPVRFWNDPDDSRYRAAYFEHYPGVWRHGDWITLTERGSVVVHGRSDSTLNRNGIRMGSADIYQAVEALPEVAEALVIGVEEPDGGYWMPLFVATADGVVLDDDLRERIRAAIRTEVSPRHVPDDVIAVPAVPHTRTGKKLEVPLKRLFAGADPARVVDRSAVDDPALVDWFAARAADWRTRT